MFTISSYSITPRDRLEYHIPTMSQASSGLTQIMPEASTTFPQFSLLPAELRDKVWEFALPGPRIIYLYEFNTRSHGCSRVWSNKPNHSSGNAAFYDLDNPSDSDHVSITRTIGPCHGFKSVGSTIPLMFACKEAYNIGVKTYPLSFGTTTSFPATRFNFEIDTLYIARKRFNPLPSLNDCIVDVTKVLNIAIDAKVLDYHWDDSLEEIATLLRLFGNVRNLYLAIKYHGETHGNLTGVHYIDLCENPEYAVSSHELHAATKRILQENGMYLEDLEYYLDTMNELLGEFGLEEERQKDLGSDGNPTWQLPNVEVKLITTAARKDILEAQKRMIDRERAERKLVKISIGINDACSDAMALLDDIDHLMDPEIVVPSSGSFDYGSVWAEVPETTKVGELLEKFIKEKGLRPDLEVFSIEDSKGNRRNVDDDLRDIIQGSDFVVRYVEFELTINTEQPSLAVDSEGAQA
ncbi:hypothetical protein B0O99DRAFT_618526 [Bisporella sp. PMI_857]|nr:hypothetical protein B0O99DRAFT_618526 [Bisporella sp. PMI_857]